MRLLNTHNHALAEFNGENIPPYAILSHTWTEDEVSYQDWMHWIATNDVSMTRRLGFTKIMSACEQARGDGLDWLWVDTNCIDKTSSSELSESINSMYAWYGGSEICYAYMSDVSSTDQENSDPLCHFRKSRWFTRGWTLQELLAPGRLVFFSREWARIGNMEGPLVDAVAEATGIRRSYLIHLDSISSASTARKMSWLSRRETTRIEDMAYCMLGIFEISMPLLYGEGAKAFIRLQEEIVRTRNDHTIFCWTWNFGDTFTDWTSMFAPSPEAFQQSETVIQRVDLSNLAPCSVTNLGLSISVPVMYSFSRLWMILDAGYEQEKHDRRICIPVRRSVESAMVFERQQFPESPISLQLWRTSALHRCSLFVSSKPKMSRLKQTALPAADFGLLFFIEPEVTQLLQATRSPSNSDTQPMSAEDLIISTHPPGCFDASKGLLCIPPCSDRRRFKYAATMKIESLKQDSYFIICVVTSYEKPRWACYITTEADLLRKRPSLNNNGTPVLLTDAFEYLMQTMERMLYTHIDFRISVSRGSVVVVIGSDLGAYSGITTKTAIFRLNRYP